MKQHLKKSMKLRSVHLSTEVILFVFGRLSLPLELGFRAGWLLSSKNKFLRVETSRTSSSGIPHISIISPSWSISLSPANIGYPQNSSANIQPQLHISIADVYGMPSMISGAR